MGADFVCNLKGRFCLQFKNISYGAGPDPGTAGRDRRGPAGNHYAAGKSPV